jgi:hypothetical protein
MKVRCSSIGKLMAASRSKKEQLSKTAKSYIQDVVLEHKYGIKKEFSSRYTDKGNECEQDSITLANEVLDVGFIYKNEEHFENDYIIGTPDVNTSKVLLDVKTSFNGTTFPFFEEKIPNKDYFYQLQGYMWLTGKEESLLVYCLTNTPKQIVEDEIRRVHWKEHQLEESDEIRHYVEAKHNFDHIPLEKRVKVFKIQKDESVIEAIKEKIELAREYYNKIIETI